MTVVVADGALDLDRLHRGLAVLDHEDEGAGSG